MRLNFMRGKKVLSGRLWLLPVVIGLLLPFGEVASQQEFDFAKRLYEDGMYLQAAEELRSFIRDHPEDPKAPSAQLLLAESYLKAGLAGRALEEYESFILQRPDDTDVLKAWQGRAKCLLELGRFGEAGETYLQIQRIYPFSSFAPEALLSAALSFRRDGDLQRASEALRLLLGDYPKSACANRARYELGLALKEMGRPDEALESLRQVDRSSEEGPGALLASIEILLGMDDLESANKAFAELKSGFPNSDHVGKALLLIGSYMTDKGNLKDGVSYLDEASHFRGGLAAEAMLKLGWAYHSLGRDSLAADAFSSVLDGDVRPEDMASAMLGLGRSLLALGDYADAADVLRRLSVMEEAPASRRLDALEELGEAYRRSGNYHMAIEAYQLCAGKSDTAERRARALYSVAEIYERDLGWPEQAARYYSQLVADSSDYASKALLALAECRRKSGDLKGALISYREFLRRFPELAEAGDVARSIRIMEELGSPDYQGAVSELLGLLSMSPSEIPGDELPYRICRIRYDRLRDFEGAAEGFSKYLKRYPSGKFAPEARYFLAESYGKIALQRRVDGDSLGSESAMGKALENYSLLYRLHPESDLADDAFVKFTEVKARSISSDSARCSFILKSYTGFINTFVSSDRLDFALLRIADAYRCLARSDTTYLQQAISIYRRLPEQFPESSYLPDAMFGLGMAYVSSGDSSSALELFSRLAAGYPGSPHSWRARFRMAELLASMGRYGEALENCEWLLRNRRPDMSYLSVLKLTASIYERQGMWGEAARLYRDALDVPSSSGYRPSIIRQVARCYEMADSLREALSWYRRYLDLRPEGGPVDSVLVAVSRISRELGDVEGATGALERLVAEMPGSPLAPEARIALAELYCDGGNYDGALSIYRNLGRGNAPDPEISRGAIICLLRMGRLKEAEREFAKFRKRFRGDKGFEARFLYEKGLSYERKKSYAEAISSFQAIRGKFKSSAYADDALYHIGLARYLGGDIPKAVEAFSSLLEEYPESEYVPDTCMKLGNIYYSSRKLADALQYYRRIFSSSDPGPLAADAMWNAILSYETLGLFEDALNLCRELMERFPGYEKVPRIKFKIGFFLMELGKYRDAIAQFERCLVGANGETEAEVRFHIAECYFNLGDYSRAVSTYLKVAYMNRDQMLWAVTAEYKAGMTYERMGKFEEAKKLYKRMVAYYGAQSEWGRAAAERLAELKGSPEADR